VNKVLQQSLEFGGEEYLAELEPEQSNVTFKGKTEGERDFIVFFFDKNDKELGNIKKMLIRGGHGHEGDSRLLKKVVREKLIAKEITSKKNIISRIIEKKITIQAQTVFKDFEGEA
jgi:hypothetical protein